MITKPAMFEHASRYEGQLTERQREVLRLIAEGMTNGQIAERLDVTLAGAKWHVAEILSKLGLESREQAAEYYRWRHSRANGARRLLRAFTGGAVGRAALGTAAAGAVVAGALWFWQGSQPELSDTEEPGQPFFAEGAWTVESAGTTYQGTMRWWYQGDQRWRVESQVPEVTRMDGLGGVTPTGRVDDIVVVRDGTDQWYWIQSEPLFHRNTLDTSPVWVAAVGPVTGGDLKAFLNLQDGVSQPRVTGRDVILGRDVSVVELDEVSGGDARRLRVWLDEARMFVMRLEDVDKDSTSRLEVTRLDYGVSQPAERYTWTAPAGTVEERCWPGGGRLQGGPINLPDPFLELPAPGVVTAGGTTSRERSGGMTYDETTGGCAAYDSEFRGGMGPDRQVTLKVHQEVRDPASVLPAAGAEEIALAGGVRAQYHEGEDGMRTLAWVDGALGVSLRSSVMSRDELVTAANALLGE